MKKQINNKGQKVPRTIDAVRARCNEELTDVVTGPMTLTELTREIASQCLHRSPEYMVILIEKRPELQKYHSTIYLTKKDFRNYKLHHFELNYGRKNKHGK